MTDYSFTNRPALPSWLQSHHILTQFNIGHSEMLGLMHTTGLLNVRDFYTNGLALPVSADATTATGLLRHVGNHEHLRAFQSAQLARIESEWQTRTETLKTGGLSEAEARIIAARDVAPQVHSLQSVLRTGVAPLVNAARDLVDLSGNVLTAAEVRAGGLLTPLTADDPIYRKLFGGMPLGEYYSGIKTDGWASRADARLGAIGSVPTFDVLNPVHTTPEARTANLLGGYDTFERVWQQTNAQLDFHSNPSNLANTVSSLIKTGNAPNFTGIDFSFLKYFTPPKVGWAGLVGATAPVALDLAGTYITGAQAHEFARAGDHVNYWRIVAGYAGGAIGGVSGAILFAPGFAQVIGGLAGGGLGEKLALLAYDKVASWVSNPVDAGAAPAYSLMELEFPSLIPSTGGFGMADQSGQVWMRAERTSSGDVNLIRLDANGNPLFNISVAPDGQMTVTQQLATATLATIFGAGGVAGFDYRDVSGALISRGEVGAGGVGRTQYFDSANTQPWNERRVEFDADGHIADDTLYDNGTRTTIYEAKLSINDQDAVVRTTWNYDANDDPVGIPQQSVDIPGHPPITASSIGSLLGSSLGQAIGGSNIFAQVAAGTALSAVLGNLGRSLDGFLNDTGLASATGLTGPSLNDAALAGIDVDLANAFRAQSVMAISSFLTGELAEALGFDGTSFGEQLLRATTGSLLGSALNSVAAWTLPGPAPNVFDTILGNPLIGVGTFLGKYLANEIVGPTGTGGAVGGSFGGALGGLVAPTLIGSVGTQIVTSLGFAGAIQVGATLLLNAVTAGAGAFFGAWIGTLLGNLFTPDDPAGAAALILQPGDTDFRLEGSSGSNTQVVDPLVNMGNATVHVLNDVLESIGGRPLGVDDITVIFNHFVGSSGPMVVGTWKHMRAGHSELARADFGGQGQTGGDLVDQAVIQSLKHLQIAGGNLYMKRAIERSTAATLEQLGGELKIAEDYGRYLAAKPIIDALIAQAPNSAFAAGWIVTLLQAEALGITQPGKSDFTGGLASFLASFDLQRFGATLADVSFAVDDGKLIISIAQGPGEEPRQLVIDDYAAVTGLTFLAAQPFGATVNGTGKADFWFAAAGVGSTFIDGASERVTIGNIDQGGQEGAPPIDYDGYNTDLLIGGSASDSIQAGGGNDLVLGGDGNDTIDGGANDDLIVGGSGDDALTGGAGYDTFVFAPGSGADTLTDFTAGAGGGDRLDLRAYRSFAFLAPLLAQATQDGADTILNLGNGDTLRLSNVNASTLTSDDFLLAPNQAPAFILNGGSSAAGLLVPENTTAAGTIAATDQQTGTVLAYSIVGGADQAKFQINSATGALTFLAAPDFEAPTDSDGNNSYAVQVQVSDEELTDTQTITVKVTDVGPVSGNDSDNVLTGTSENDTIAALAGNDTLTGLAGNDTLTGGAGNDTLDGGAGADTAVFSGLRSAYTVASSGGGVQVSGPDGTDSLTQVERLAFADVTLSRPDAGFSGDFDGNGKSDILWQKPDGTPGIWLMDGLNMVAGGFAGAINPGPTWHIKSAADFNGDGRADILWQNDNGLPAIWLMNGLATAGGGGAGSGNPGITWDANDGDDFNGDGKADILWQNDDGTPEIWLMDGLSIISGGTVGAANPGPTWHVKGGGDFNGDGKSDILWQNDNGLPVIWLMNGLTLIGGGAAGTIQPGPTWHAHTSGDFNGDGKSDILWQHDDGTPVIWLMDGLNMIGGGAAGTIQPGPTWHVRSASDFNGDSKSDILWQHDDGTSVIWLMNGLSMIGGSAVVGPNPGFDWV